MQFTSLKNILFGCVIGILVILCGGCASEMERNFFDKEYDQAGTRFENYSIPDQIKIYLYGTQSVVPPVTVLSRQIAEHGKAAIPYLLGVLDGGSTDRNIRDLMVVFEAMQGMATYNVGSDAALMRKLDGYVNRMTDRIIRGYTQATLYRIKQSARDAD